MTITIKDPAVERDLLALAASKGGDIEEALGELLAIRRELEDPATLACSNGAPAEGPNEARRAVIRNWKQLTARVTLPELVARWSLAMADEKPNAKSRLSEAFADRKEKLCLL